MMLELINLRKKFGTFEALKGINLHVKKGEIYGFLGPNGAGKTTTIKIITGILLPTSGDAVIGGYSILKDSQKAKQLMGIIPDRPFIYERLTGREFLYFVASLYGFSSSEIKNDIDSFLEIFDLQEWQNELIENYSHGMKQRLVMIAAFIHNPQLIVVDEPMVGLDPKGARLIKKTFWKLARERGITIFMSTHSLEVAEEMCDRIGIIDRGTLIAEGTTEELREMAGSGKEEKLEDIFLKLTGETSLVEKWIERI